MSGHVNAEYFKILENSSKSFTFRWTSAILLIKFYILCFIFASSPFFPFSLPLSFSKIPTHTRRIISRKYSAVREARDDAFFNLYFSMLQLMLQLPLNNCTPTHTIVSKKYNFCQRKWQTKSTQHEREVYDCYTWSKYLFEGETKVTWDALKEWEC